MSQNCLMFMNAGYLSWISAFCGNYPNMGSSRVHFFENMAKITFLILGQATKTVKNVELLENHVKTKKKKKKKKNCIKVCIVLSFFFFGLRPYSWKLLAKSDKSSFDIDNHFFGTIMAQIYFHIQQSYTLHPPFSLGRARTAETAFMYLDMEAGTYDDCTSKMLT